MAREPGAAPTMSGRAMATPITSENPPAGTISASNFEPEIVRFRRPQAGRPVDAMRSDPGRISVSMNAAVSAVGEGGAARFYAACRRLADVYRQFPAKSTVCLLLNDNACGRFTTFMADANMELPAGILA